MLIKNYAEICPVASMASRMFTTTGASPAEGMQGISVFG